MSLPTSVMQTPDDPPVFHIAGPQERCRRLEAVCDRVVRFLPSCRDQLDLAAARDPQALIAELHLHAELL